MSKIWQLQEAKNCLSEVINQALMNGPQIITRHGEETAVVMSMNDYHKKKRTGKSLLKILQSFPRGVRLDLTRNPSSKSRDAKL
jgi:prevent-host-death family protein